VADGENLLIARLPRQARMRLLAMSEPVLLQHGTLLGEACAPARHVYFPLSGLAALVTSIEGQRVLGVGMVGREGMLGAQLALGVLATPLPARVLGSCTARRIDAGLFRRELARCEALHRVLHFYLYVLLTQLATTAACSHFHQVGPRLARWLLMSEDRTEAGSFLLTHECLASMLGVRREGVTEAAGVLQQRALIHYHRGEIQVLDRSGLEAAACACYAIDRHNYDTLLV
jgi:CRP-like cAMP-binding protein